MADQVPDQSEICIGIRVCLRRPGLPERVGMVVSGLEGYAPGLSKFQVFISVLPEGSATSRAESWPLAQISLLPKEQQLPKFGGCFQPPKGYPLRTRSS